MRPQPNVIKREMAVSSRLDGMSYAEIGRQLGITRERVRQILKGSKAKSKKPVVSLETMLSTSKAAELLKVHVNTVRRWGNSGVLPEYRVGSRGDRRFSRQDVEKLLSKELKHIEK